MLLPRRMNGGAMTIPDTLRLIEEVARIDASAGWNLAICGGGPIFGHYLSARHSKKSTAIRVVSPRLAQSDDQPRDPRGRWFPFQRQGYLCERFGAGELSDGGGAHAERWRAANGQQTSRSCAPASFPIKNVKILNTWSTRGCAAPAATTASSKTSSFPTSSLSIGSMRRRPGSVAPLPHSARLQMAGELAAVVLGTARHALDTLNEIAQAKVPTASHDLLRDGPSRRISSRRPKVY